MVLIVSNWLMVPRRLLHSPKTPNIQLYNGTSSLKLEINFPEDQTQALFSLTSANLSTRKQSKNRNSFLQVPLNKRLGLSVPLTNLPKFTDLFIFLDVAPSFGTSCRLWANGWNTCILFYCSYQVNTYLDCLKCILGRKTDLLTGIRGSLPVPSVWK